MDAETQQRLIPKFRAGIKTDTKKLSEVAALVSKHLTNNVFNHRMLGVGRDLCGSSSPTPLPKQGHLQQARPFMN